MNKWNIEYWITQHWYKKKKTWLAYVLFIFSMIFSAIVFLRRWFHNKNWLKSYRADCPVIVVGNITVGGVGKTPLVIALYFLLKEKGWTPGIVSRGYKGSYTGVAWVSSDSNPKQVGEEAVLLAARTGGLVVVSRNRVAAIQALTQESACNIILSDDGLQHYAMRRDIEIAVIDAGRQLGNQLCLPAGPLREPGSRLQTIDLLVQNGGNELEYSFSLFGSCLINLLDSHHIEDVAILKNKKVHAITGIGAPERFFNYLRSFGADVIAYPYPDHYLFEAKDFESFFVDDFLIMTEKDAIKCRAFAKKNMWFLPVDAKLNVRLLQKLEDYLRGLKKTIK